MADIAAASEKSTAPGPIASRVAWEDALKLRCVVRDATGGLIEKTYSLRELERADPVQYASTVHKLAEIHKRRIAALAASAAPGASRAQVLARAGPVIAEARAFAARVAVSRAAEAREYVSGEYRTTVEGRAAALNILDLAAEGRALTTA